MLDAMAADEMESVDEVLLWFDNRRVDLDIHTNSYAYSHLGA